MESLDTVLIVCQIGERNKCLLFPNYSSEKRYKEERMESSEGAQSTKAILLAASGRDGAYIKVIASHQTEYKDSGRAVIHVTD